MWASGKSVRRCYLSRISSGASTVFFFPPILMCKAQPLSHDTFGPGLGITCELNNVFKCYRTSGTALLPALGVISLPSQSLCLMAHFSMELPWWFSGKESACKTWVWSLGQESLKKEMAAHSSILAWEIPWTEEPGALQSRGLQRGGHGLTTKQWQPPFTTAASRTWS